MLSYIRQLLLICLCVLPFYVLARILYRRQSKGQAKVSHEILLALFVLFLCGLMALVLRPGSGFAFAGIPQAAAARLKDGTGINLVPFRTIGRFFRTRYRGSDFAATMGMSAPFMVNILGNIFMFVPIGLFPPLLWKRFRSAWKILILAFGFPVCIEFIQLFIGRSVDVDDVILNAVGILIGYLLYRFGSFVAKRLRKST